MTIMRGRKEYQITGGFVLRFRQNIQFHGHLREQWFGLFERRAKMQSLLSFQRTRSREDTNITHATSTELYTSLKYQPLSFREIGES